MTGWMGNKAAFTARRLAAMLPCTSYGSQLFHSHHPRRVAAGMVLFATCVWLLLACEPANITPPNGVTTVPSLAVANLAEASPTMLSKVPILPTETASPTRVAQSPKAQVPSPTITFEPGSSASVVVPPTPTPTSTNTPNPTLTPTEDFSFYTLADCLPTNTLVTRGNVVQIVDGDTIHVRLEDGNTYRVRYIGIDAPELERPFSGEATQANYALVINQDVTLIQDVSDTDANGRLLRYVVAGGVFVNQELVKLGVARAVDYPPDSACASTFLSTQAAAQASQLGMWTATQTPESSAPQVVIVMVNKKEEWVDLQNQGTVEVDLSGWNLVSERGDQGCPLSGVIRAGETLRVWAMAAQVSGFTCGYQSPIWNNSEPDAAVLYNAAGEVVSRR